MILGVLGIMLLFAYYSHGTELPSVDALKKYEPLQSVRVMDRNGRLIAILGKQRRSVIEYDKIPRIMVQATLAAEDARFFRHKGLNYMGMLRAFWINLAAGRYKQGGSTITQQVVKGLLLTPERSLRRKFQEVILARRVESALTKEQILHIYLNEIYFGHGRYGVEEAARFYFRKSAAEISIAEAALLAALPQGPELNSPIRHPERARERQAYVLQQMARQKFISQEEVKKALETPLLPGEPEVPDNLAAPELVTLLSSNHGEQLVQASGKQLVTTLDLRMQEIAKKALHEELLALDKRQNVTRLELLEGKKLAAHLEKLRQIRRLHSGTIYEGVVVERKEGRIIVDMGKQRGQVVDQMDRYYPAGYHWGQPPAKKPAEKKSRGKKNTPSKADEPAPPHIQPGHVFRVKVLPGESGNPDAPLRLRAELGPQGAVVVMTVAGREILAMVGGIPMVAGDFNRAHAGLRQPGSTFKPFLFASALMQKKLTPAAILRDDPEVYEKWIPRSGTTFHGKVTARRALALSLNTPAVQVAQIAGLDEVTTLAGNAGITTILRRDLSLALGSSEVRLVDMVNAFGVFPSGGMAAPVRMISRIGNREVPPPEATRVMDPASAWLMTSLLRSVITHGTGRRASDLKFPVAGKTGTSNASRDVWFVGFSPEILCGVWIGYDDLKPLGRREEGGRTAVPVFASIMRQIHEKRPVKDFFIPPGIVTREIDPDTGEAVLPSAKKRITEYFLEGTEPELPVLPPDPVLPDDPTSPSAGDLLTM